MSGAEATETKQQPQDTTVRKRQVLWQGCSDYETSNNKPLVDHEPSYYNEGGEGDERLLDSIKHLLRMKRLAIQVNLPILDKCGARSAGDATRRGKCPGHSCKSSPMLTYARLPVETKAPVVRHGSTLSSFLTWPADSATTSTSLPLILAAPATQLRIRARPTPSGCACS